MTEAIREYENRRYAAVLAGDSDALAPLLHRDLRYIHSSGTVQNRDQYLADLANKVWIYREARHSDETITELGDAALVSNQLDMTVVFNGDVHPVHSTALSVWVKSEGSWQLIAVQSTAVPDSAKKGDKLSQSKR